MDKVLFVQLPEEEFFERLAEAICKRLDTRIQTLVSPNSNSPNQNWLTHKEAANYLKIAPPTLYGLTSKRKIKFYKRGRRNYFRVEELEKYLARGEVKTEEEIVRTKRRIDIPL